jgi:hypothetical protein
MGFHKIAPYYYTGWHEPGSELQFLINLKKYNTLPKDLQAILMRIFKPFKSSMVLISFLNQPPIWLPVLPPMMDLILHPQISRNLAKQFPYFWRCNEKI